MWRALIPVILLVASPGAWAHSRITSPVPRNDFDDIKDSNALHPPPCGGPRGTVVLAKQVGDTLQVTWDETIDHLGHYEILFSMAGDANFAFLTDPAGVTLNNIADVQGGTLPHHYSQMVKLPSTACPACTLQVKQFMEGAGYYMSCADVQLTAAAPPASPAPVADGGAPPDLSTAPQAQPTGGDPSPQPSTPPPADDPAPAATPDAPDMATPTIGPTKYDYSYGCSTVPGSSASLPLIFFLLISVPGIARIAARSRSR